MLTWMQRHKKWLVITIWISVIAFVGAGFVGWGSYQYGSSSGSVAVVGDRKISVDEYQREYSSLYRQYSQVYGNKFNQEMAKKIGLPDAALSLAIQKNLILSYADDLGLLVTDKDIAKELVQMPSFIKDGKFDKELYVKVLSQNGELNVTIPESQRVISISDEKVISASIDGNVTLTSIADNSQEHFNLKKTVAGASVKGDTLAVLFANDDIALYNVDSKAIFFR